MKTTLKALSTARSAADLEIALSQAQRELYQAAIAFGGSSKGVAEFAERLELAAEAYAIARAAMRAMDGISS